MKPLSVTGIGGLQTPLFKIPQRGVAKVEKILGGGKIFAFKHLVIGIRCGGYRKAVTMIKKREQEIGTPLLEPVLKAYSMSKRPKWATEAEESANLSKKCGKSNRLSPHLGWTWNRTKLNPAMLSGCLSRTVVRFVIPDWPEAGQSVLRVNDVMPLENGHVRFAGEPA